MKRPLAITIWAGIMTLWAVMRCLGLAHFYLGPHGIGRIGELQLGLFSISTVVVQVAVATGLWMNRKWAIVLYLVWDVVSFLAITFWLARGLEAPPYRAVVWVCMIALFAATTLPSWKFMHWRSPRPVGSQ